jgi:transcriptional regulator with XRE-family HTH domain|nr:helix-turn-helix transcriptional regulator [Kofleriaceae bacterium]
MVTREELLLAIGRQLREARLAAHMTQQELGRRVGIVGKYVSEIERGTRDLPLSRLSTIVQRGFGLQLGFEFRRDPALPLRVDSPSLPSDVDTLAWRLAQIPDAKRHQIIALIEKLVATIASSHE